MVAPTIYRSDDSSAPSLTGTVGSLVALLKAILVDGYGSKTAAGWTEPYTSTNKAVFKQGAGHQRYLRVDDTAAQMARLTAFESMSGVDTGSYSLASFGIQTYASFPTNAQVSGGLYMRKSTTADSTARPWLCVASNKIFYLIVGGSTTTIATLSGGDSHLTFGDFESVIIGDRYNTVLAAATNSSTSDTSNALGARHSLTNFSSTGRYTLGNGLQLLSPSNVTIRSMGVNSQTSSGVGGAAVPNPADSKVRLSRIAVMETSTSPPTNVANVLRGYMPGLWAPDHLYSGFTTLDTMSGAVGSSLEGKNFLIVNTAGTNCVVFETNGGY